MHFTGFPSRMEGLNFDFISPYFIIAGKIRGLPLTLNNFEQGSTVDPISPSHPPFCPICQGRPLCCVFFYLIEIASLYRHSDFSKICGIYSVSYSFFSHFYNFTGNIKNFRYAHFSSAGLDLFFPLKTIEPV